MSKDWAEIERIASTLMLCDMCGALNEYLAIQCWNCGYFFSQADYILNLGDRLYKGEELRRRVEEYLDHCENDSSY